MKKEITAEALSAWATKKRRAVMADKLSEAASIAAALAMTGRAIDADGTVEWTLKRSGRVVLRWREPDAPGLAVELRALLAVVGLIARDVHAQAGAAKRAGAKSGEMRRHGSAAERIRRQIARSPAMSDKDIADRCNVTVQYVGQVRRAASRN